MKEFAKIERAVHAIAPSVNVSIENNCVVLRGELDNWDDVVRCGRAAVSKKYQFALIPYPKLQKSSSPNLSA